MTRKSGSSGGWSLRKALVRRIAQAVNEYERERNRPPPGQATSPAPDAGTAGHTPRPTADDEVTGNQLESE